MKSLEAHFLGAGSGQGRQRADSTGEIWKEPPKRGGSGRRLLMTYAH